MSMYRHGMLETDEEDGILIWCASCDEWLKLWKRGDTAADLDNKLIAHNQEEHPE